MKKSNLSITLLAACVGALAVPAVSHAANVGYYGSCGGGSQAAAITAAGHTPVAVSTLDAASLAPLAALMYEECNYSPSTAVATAVANGMALIVHDWGSYYSQPTVALPGSAGVNVVYAPGDPDDVTFPAGSPIVSGPGGALTNASLDNGYSSFHGYAPVASLPAGTQVLATNLDPTRAVTFTYTTGQGRVVFSTIPLSHYLVGGAGTGGGAPVVAGMQAYAANLVAWAAGPSFTTCAAEGYTSAKLTMCRSICETTQSSATLTNKIKLYTAIYREAPPCGR